MKKWTKEAIHFVKELYDYHTYEEIAEIINKKFSLNKTPNAIRKAYERYKVEPKDFSKQKRGPKILIFDIELFPMEVYTWSIWQDSIPLSMVKKDWSVLSFAYKWLDEDAVHYYDVYGQKDLRDDSKILKHIWKALDEADIVVGHNSDSFDIKKLNMRFKKHKMQPPSSYRKMDTKKMAKRAFSHSSNKLDFLSQTHNKEYKKLKHSKYPGFELWESCLKNDPDAFKELELYNRFDVLATAELFEQILPWDNSINFSVYSEEDLPSCSCGSVDFKKNGFYYTNASKFQKYRCTNCGKQYRDKTNLLNKSKRKNMRMPVRQ